MGSGMHGAVIEYLGLLVLNRKVADNSNDGGLPGHCIVITTEEKKLYELDRVLDVGIMIAKKCIFLGFS